MSLTGFNLHRRRAAEKAANEVKPKETPAPVAEPVVKKKKKKASR